VPQKLNSFENSFWFWGNFDTHMNILVHFSFNGANFLLQLFISGFFNVLSQFEIFFSDIYKKFSMDAYLEVWQKIKS